MWQAMAERALAAGHELGVFGQPGPGVSDRLQRLVAAGAKLFTWKMSRHRPINRLIRRWQFREVLRYRPDVVYINQSEPVLVASLPGLRVLVEALIAERIPYVLMSHMDPDWPAMYSWQWQAADPLYAAAARVIVNSEYGRSALQRKFAHELSNVTIVPNPPGFAKVDALAWPETPQPCLASVARYDINSKAQDILFEAFANLKSELGDWRLDCYGAGIDRRRLEELIRYFGIDRQVKLHDFVDDVRSVWSEHQALVLASRHELHPVAMVEAMVCGRPVFSTPAAGVVDWLQDESNGLLAADCSVPALVAMLRRASQERHRWRAMGEQARTDAIRLLTPWPGDALWQVIREAAAGRNAVVGPEPAQTSGGQR
ncbi:MAG: glycosyltransferase [Planctomycetes bacterium]|nr:glycosyltransferase [Planctomycetota bacterium]